ncbi:MAG: translation initiation factor IF-3, partial [candidate division WOR-3 bacterium]
MKELNYRVNENIRAREVQVIGPDGKNLGIMRTIEAIQLAKSMGLDLVEVSP